MPVVLIRSEDGLESMGGARRAGDRWVTGDRLKVRRTIGVEECSVRVRWGREGLRVIGKGLGFRRS